ncbi:MAG: hypothetical protein LBB49_02090 [Gracilibacteraceae bacterium]|jgi:hypothetical protein|nr:hypothetical protein [Gracilibacteraceae bacterium]
MWEERTHQRMKKWALFAALFLGNLSLILSYLFQSEMIYSACKAVIMFAVMYFICRIVIATWDKVNRRDFQLSQDDFSSIKTTLEALDDLDEKGVKVTYNPQLEPSGPDRADEKAGVTAGQINADLLGDRG